MVLQAGQQEVMIDRLPGFPDGITSTSSGTFWVAIVVPEMGIVKYLSNKCVPVHTRNTLPDMGRKAISMKKCLFKVA